MKRNKSGTSDENEFTEADQQQLYALAADDMRERATTLMRRERHNHTLGVDGLVSETFLRICQHAKRFKNKQQFHAQVALTMRQVLVDHARKKAAAKRGGDVTHASLTAEDIESGDEETFIVELNDVLEALQKKDPNVGNVVNLHYFGGRTDAQIAEIMNISVATVGRYMKFGRDWVLSQLSDVKGFDP